MERQLMTIYRKIWSEHFGNIPKDSDGRSHEIHHIDGNRSNNNIENLKCVSIQEHYDIHYFQEDWMACFKIAQRMDKSPKLLSELASLNNLKRSIEGKNPFNGPMVNKSRIENGTHHLLGGNLQKQQVINKTHNFVVNNPSKNQLIKGSHPCQISWTCEYCGKSGKNAGNYARFHGINCKNKGG